MTIQNLFHLFLAAGIGLAAHAVDRPETKACPFKTSVTAGGTYANGNALGTDYVVSGTISSALTFSSDVPYRVTLDGATLAAPITLGGDATLWLKGASALVTSKAAEIGRYGVLKVCRNWMIALALLGRK